MPAQRPARFAVGRLEFDPRKVSSVSDGEVPFVLDTSVKGKSNRRYGASASIRGSGPASVVCER